MFAEVACRVLNYIVLIVTIFLGFTLGYADSLGYAVSPDSTAPILLGFLQCTGKEENLLACSQHYKNANDFDGCRIKENVAALKCTGRYSNSMHCSVTYNNFFSITQSQV